MSKKVPPLLKALIGALADCAISSRTLNKTIMEELNKLGVNTDNKEFDIVFSYVKGDGDQEPLISYLENEENYYDRT
jgi:hypothetical protein